MSINLEYPRCYNTEHITLPFAEFTFETIKNIEIPNKFFTELALTLANFVCKELNVKPLDKLDNSIEHYLPLVKSIIRMENGKQPYDDELLVEGMYKAWEGYPTGSLASQNAVVLQFMYTHGIKDTVKRNGFATKVVEQALSIL